MANKSMALFEQLCNGEDPEAEFLQEGVRWLVQELVTRHRLLIERCKSLTEQEVTRPS